MAHEDATEEVDPGWTVQLMKVERIVPMDSESIDDGNLFSVEFEVSGPNMNGSFEVLVNDIANETEIVSLAMDVAQDGLESWARMLERRKGAERIEPANE